MRTKQPYAALQPKDGDLCVHCGHIHRKTEYHFWMVDAPFVRPNGTVCEAKWLICCDPCFHLAKGDSREILIRGDSAWRGDEPFVKSANNPYVDRMAAPDSVYN